MGNAVRSFTSQRLIHVAQVLPSLTPTAEFWWRKLGAPFSSMLQTAKFPISSQCRFLCFVYARIINMMGPANSSGVGSVMTIDGSPVELSWVIPPTGTTKDRANREVRFAIEPRWVLSRWMGALQI